MPWRDMSLLVLLVSSQSTRSASASSRSARSVTSSRLPIGVAQTASGTVVYRVQLLEGDQPGAHHARLLAELGSDDTDAVTPRGKRIPAQRLERGPEQQVERFTEAAADDDRLRIEDVDQAGHAGAELPPQLHERSARPLVAIACRSDELVRIPVRAQQLLGKLVGGAPGDEVLEVPSSRAEAAALRPVVLEHHVTELGGRTARAAVEPPAEDETAADPRAEGQHDHVLRAAAGADRPLGHSGRVRVVVERHRQARGIALRARAAAHLPAVRARRRPTCLRAGRWSRGCRCRRRPRCHLASRRRSPPAPPGTLPWTPLACLGARSGAPSRRARRRPPGSSCRRRRCRWFSGSP